VDASFINKAVDAVAQVVPESVVPVATYKLGDKHYQAVVLADDTGAIVNPSKPFATTGYKTGTQLYFAEAAPGSVLSDPVWRAFLFDSSTLRKTWADGNENFDNVATDLTALVYS
jgi:hypothetical protein